MVFYYAELGFAESRDLFINMNFMAYFLKLLTNWKCSCEETIDNSEPKNFILRCCNNQFPTMVSLYPVVTRTVVPAGCTSFRQIAWLLTTG